MIRPVLMTMLLLSFLAGCASSEGDATTETSEPTAAESAANGGEAAESQAGDATGETREPAKSEIQYPIQPRSYGMSPEDLRIWNEPWYRRWFAQSYIAETEVEPGISVVEREQLLQVYELISGDQLNEAVALLEEIQGPATSAVFDFMLGNIYFQQENYVKGGRYLQLATEKYPKFLRAWRAIGNLKIREGDYANAIVPLTKTIQLGGGDALTYGLLGFAYTSVGNDLSAETALRYANLLDPTTSDWRMFLAQSLFKQRRYADAVALTQTMINENENRADLWMLQSKAFIGLEKPVRAAENLEIVDRLGKSTPQSLNLLGDIYMNEELFELAVNAYIRAMTLDRESKPERAIRATKILTARSALEEAEKLIARIEELHADHLSEDDRIEMKRLEARIAVSRGETDAQVSKLKEIVELDPLDGDALILLGQHAALIATEQEDEKEMRRLQAEAIFYYERAAAIEDFEADAKVRHAQLLVSQGKYQEALPLLRRAQAVKPRKNIQEYLEQVERISKGSR